MRPDWRVIGAAGRALSAIGLLAAVWILLLQTCSRAFRMYGNDFTGYLVASRVLWDGENPYHASTPFPFVYPLFLGVILRPLALMPYFSAVGVWFAANVVALVACTLIASPQAVIGLATIVVFLGVIQNNLLNGQINAIVLVLALLFGVAYARGRRSLASVLLSSAIALKVTPVLLLIFLARRQELPMIAAIVALTLIFTVGLPWLIAGSPVLDFYRDYLEIFVLPRLQGTGGIDPFVFSLAGAWARLSGGTLVFAAALLFAAAVVAFLLWADRGAPRSAPPAVPRGAEHETSTLMTVCLYLAAALLVTPISEQHHLIVLMPGLLFLAHHVWRGRALPRGLLAGPIAGLALAYTGIAAMRLLPGAAFVAVVATCVLLAMAIGPVGPAGIRRTPARRSASCASTPT